MVARTHTHSHVESLSWSQLLRREVSDYAWKKVQKPPSTRPRHEHTHIRVTDTQTKHDASMSDCLYGSNLIGKIF